MSEEERRLLDWVAARIPQRTIAEWLGLSYEATAKRISRLVRRLRATALREVAHLDGTHYRQVERALRSAGVVVPAGQARMPV